MVRLRGRTGNRNAVHVAGTEPRQCQRVDNGNHHTYALRSVRRGGEVRYHGGHVQVEEPAVVARGSCHWSSGDACGIGVPSAPGGSKKPRPVNIDANHLLTQTLQMRGRGICPLPHL